MKIRSVFLFLVLSFLSGHVFAEPVNITPANAGVFFNATHDLGYTIGYFKDFSGTIELNDEKTQLVSAKAVVQTASISTHNLPRDEGLKSALFLDAVKFPQAIYENGALTIKGISKPFVFKLEKDTASGKIILKGSFNRNDYGMTYNKPLTKKKKSIGDMVEIIVELKS